MRWGVMCVHCRKARALREMQLLQTLSARLRSSEAFKACASSKNAVCMFHITENQLCTATNDACDRLFRCDAELVDDHVKRKAIISLIFAMLVAPDDRWVPSQPAACRASRRAGD